MPCPFRVFSHSINRVTDFLHRQLGHFSPIFIVFQQSHLTPLISRLYHLGYKCLRATLFLGGFVFGSILTFTLLEEEKLLPSLANAGVAVGGGLLLGLLAMVIPFVGFFISGLQAGLSLGVALVSLLVLAYQPSTQWFTIGLLFASGVICALVTLKWRRLSVLIGSSLVGAALISAGFDYFLELFYTASFVWRRIAVLTPLPLPHCWYSWALVALWPLLFLVGCLIQTCVTSRGVVHTIGERIFQQSIHSLADLVTFS